MEGHFTGERQEAKEEYKEIKRKYHQPHLASLSAFSIVPLEKRSKELSYFNRLSKDEHVSTYDAIFKRPQEYNEKLHRDDRKHAKHNDLNINAEETSRPVAVLSSSEYGRHLNLHVDKVNRDHVRIGLVHVDFHRKNGISNSVEEGYGSVIPS